MGRRMSEPHLDPVLPSDETTERRRWMAVLARADAAQLAARLAACGPLPGWRVLRGPESGLVMLRGRTGGSGAAFNLGEMTVTRCTVRSDNGCTGHAYVVGREPRRAELAAIADALLQDSLLRPLLHRTVIEPLATAQTDRRTAVAGRAAATRVQFFALRTMRS